MGVRDFITGGIGPSTPGRAIAYFVTGGLGGYASTADAQLPPPAPITAPPSALAAAYARQLRALFPRGAAWAFEAGSKLAQLIQAMAEEFARIHARADALIVEADPRRTTELLSDWERTLGLPDPCVSAAQTVAQRRAAVLARLTQVGSMNKSFYIQLAAKLGYTITITEPAANTWRVNSPETTVTWARCGTAVCGDPIRSWGNEILECAISRVAPAHAVLQFAYGS